MIIVDTFQEAQLAAISEILELDGAEDSFYTINISYDWERQKWCVDEDSLWGENPCPDEELEED